MIITIPTWGLGNTGGERIISRYADGFVERGHEVNVLLPKGTVPRVYKLKANIIETKWFITDINPTFGLLDSTIKLKSKIPPSDVIIANIAPTILPTILSKKGLPVYFVQGPEAIVSFQKKGYYFYRWLAKYGFKFFIHIITVSHWLDDLIFSLSKKRTIIVSNGIDLDTFYPRIHKSESDEKIVLCIGGGLMKGINDIIKAMEIVTAKINKMKLLVVNWKGEHKEVPFKIEKIGFVSDMELATLYNSCDVFVNASWYEGFGLPSLEAMACGAPVVTTDCGGITEYAINNHNALITPIKNPKALAGAIIKILEDDNLRAKLCQNGIETAKKFSLEKAIDKFEKTLLQIKQHS